MLTNSSLKVLSMLWKDLDEGTHCDFDDVMLAVLGTCAVVTMLPVTALFDLLASPLEIVIYIIYKIVKKKGK